VPPRPPRRPVVERIDERPKPPWHPFPLVELCVLVGIVCIVAGFFTRGGSRGQLLLALGFTLGALGGLDTAVREHFAGYRSHTLVLALFPAVVLAVVALIARLPPVIILVAVVGVFGAAFLLLRRVWERNAAP
jgi:hypothetical protein